MAKHSEVTYIKPRAKGPNSIQSKYLALTNTVLLILIALKVFKVL